MTWKKPGEVLSRIHCVEMLTAFAALLLDIGRVLDPCEASAGRRAHAFPLLLAAFITKRKTLPKKEFIVLACYDEPASSWWR
jgi:hypothetical protein